MKILVIRFSSIGDILLTSPVLRCLRQQLPQAEVHYLTKKQFHILLEHNPNVSKIHLWEGNGKIVLDQLRREKFDWIIDLHHNLRTQRVKWALGCPSRSFAKLNFQKWLYVNWKMQLMPTMHIVDRYMETVAHLGVQLDNAGLEFYPCDCDMPGPDEIPADFRHNLYVVASIGGTHATKKMPESKWIELLSGIHQPVVLVGGKEDNPAAGQILKGLSGLGKTNIWNACGQFSIGGSAHIIRQSALVISHDTGMMHMAAAFEKPVVAIWGNTTPQLGMYPFRVPSFNLEVKDLACRPCSKIGYAHCPKGHFHCMLQQDLQRSDLWKFIADHLPA